MGMVVQEEGRREGERRWEGNCCELARGKEI
jgi:hypothetical protein